MADFEGQKLVFYISAIVLLLSIPISIIYGFIVDNYLKGMNVIIYVSVALFVVFVPNWPWLNRNKPQWRPDSDLKQVDTKAQKKKRN